MLGVLDGAVLVVSAVEGVQAQTRVLMRALRRLRIPTLLFVNKIDRGGADPDRVLAGRSPRKLTPAVVPMGSGDAPRHPRGRVRPVRRRRRRGSPATLLDRLAEHDDALLAAYVADEAAVSDRRLRRALVRADPAARWCTRSSSARRSPAPASAPLIAGIAELLPATAGDADGPLSGTVFKIERGPAGREGRVRAALRRARVRRPRPDAGCGRRPATAKVTGIGVFDRGSAAPRGRGPRPAEIAKLWGLGRRPDRRRARRAAAGRAGPATSRRRRWRPWSSRAAPGDRARCTSR